MQQAFINMRQNTKAKIGVFGGSGFYNFLTSVKEISVQTPYGQPSDKVVIGEYAGQKIAFLPRHGKKHQYPPHKIPYRANLFAFKKLGVERIIAPCAAGSLQPEIKPGDFVICDQFVDRTCGREQTFFHGPEACPTKCESFGAVAHISTAEPYCPQLREMAFKCARKLKIPAHQKGTVVVINGPRFSTKSESRFFQQQGWEVINMTQYPECALAKELEMCYVNISLITDYDAGLAGSKKIKPVTTAEVVRVFADNNEKVKKLIFAMIEKIYPERSRRIGQKKECACDKSLEGAIMS